MKATPLLSECFVETVTDYTFADVDLLEIADDLLTVEHFR